MAVGIPQLAMVEKVNSYLKMKCSVTYSQFYLI